MTIFIDTSAFLAVAFSGDDAHAAAKDTWSHLVTRGEELICNNYILLETFSLLQRRFGIATVRFFQENISPVVNVAWVDQEQHRKAVSAVLVANRRNLSLVDCTSFETMRRLGIRVAFAFDPHFAEQGFDCVP